MGAWIETTTESDMDSTFLVAPLVGAWIETPTEKPLGSASSVAPLVGAWIETFFIGLLQVVDVRRAPCGRVD